MSDPTIAALVEQATALLTYYERDEIAHAMSSVATLCRCVRALRDALLASPTLVYREMLVRVRNDDRLWSRRAIERLLAAADAAASARGKNES